MCISTRQLAYAVDSSFVGGKKLILLDGVTISAPPCAVTAIMGPSGAGFKVLISLLLTS